MLISFEGLPGAGKSTQAALLAACLTHRGRSAVTLSDLATLDTEPVAATLIDLFTSSGDPYLRHGDVITETLLAAAIRADLVATRIDPALAEHPQTVVIEDRGIHTLQSYALASLLRAHRAHPDLALTWLHTLATLTGPRPGQAIWLRLPVDEALRRAAHRDHRGPTPEHRSYLHWVDYAYTELAHHDPQLTVLNVGTLQRAEVHQAVHRVLSSFGLYRGGPDTASPPCASLPPPASSPS